MTIAPGTRLGPYEIVSLLGAGGMGEVYAAHDTRLKRAVALKIMPAAIAHDPERRGRFEREAQTVAALNHPNIVIVHSIESAGDVLFLTMELVEGKTLAELIPHGGIQPGHLLPIAIAIADALSAAHQRFIVHRDLKPSNVMLTHEGRVKVLDFGIAKLLESALPPGDLETMATRSVTLEGTIVGTDAYMSPEQAEGKAVDLRSDIFSFGVLLYELASGERPFRGQTSLSVLSSILKDTPVPVTDLNPAAPAALNRVITRCLAKEPARRYQSAIDLRHDLEDVRQAVDAGASTAPAAPLPAAPARGAARWRWAAVLVGALAVASVYFANSARVNPVTNPAAPAGAATASDANLVAVAAFENRTGDRSLDPLGGSVAERLIQNLTEDRIGQIVPSPIAAGAARPPSGLVVSGSFDAQGDTITFQPKILQAGSGQLIHALEPVTVPRASPAAAFARLGDGVAGAVAMQIDGFVDPAIVSHVPTYEVYREFTSGFELFGADYARSLPQLRRATDMDPLFVWPQFYIVAGYGNQGQGGEALKALAPVLSERNRLSAGERAAFDFLDAVYNGRLTEASGRILEAKRLAPRDFMINYLAATILTWLNKPRQALDVLATVPIPVWLTRMGGMAGWRYDTSARARHMLADYEGELGDARDAVRVAPQVMNYRAAEARALVGLGRIADAMHIVDETLTAPGDAGRMLLMVVGELRVHGHREESVALAKRTAAWYRNRLVDPAPAERTRAGLAQALYLAEEWEEARKAYEGLARAYPKNVDYVGALGALAARRGDRVDATRRLVATRLKEAYVSGRNEVARARIAACLHDVDQAIDLLRDAFAQGGNILMDVHRDADFVPLGGAFQELMRPKG